MSWAPAQPAGLAEASEGTAPRLVSGGCDKLIKMWTLEGGTWVEVGARCFCHHMASEHTHPPAHVHTLDLHHEHNLRSCSHTRCDSIFSACLLSQPVPHVNPTLPLFPTYPTLPTPGGACHRVSIVVSHPVRTRTSAGLVITRIGCGTSRGHPALGSIATSSRAARRMASLRCGSRSRA